MTGHALFIGVSEYESGEFDGFDSYPTVGQSARKLHELFDASTLWGESRLVANPLRGQVMDELRSTLDACSPSDSVLVYFCGHGDSPRWRDRELHLALRDSRPRDASSQLPVHHVYDALRTCVASAKALILDCCECGDVPVLSHVDVEVPQAPDERTWVLKALRWGETTALATGSGHGEYTAFSGALIRILDDGIPAAGGLLDIGEVFTELQRNMRQEGHPLPDLISRGSGSLALLENPAPEAKQRLRYRLAGASIDELIRTWLVEPDVPESSVVEHLRARIRDCETALELAHRLHGLGSGAPNFARLLMSGPADVAGRTARLLAHSTCEDCAGFTETALELAVRLDADRLAVFHRELVADEPEGTALEVALGRLVTGERLAALVGQPEEHALAAADRLVHLFVSTRPAADVRELLTALYARGEDFAVETVLDNVAQGRSAVDAAAVALLLRGTPAEREIGKLVVHKRLPQDVARYIAEFGQQADSVLRGLLAVAVASSPPAQLIRLARALVARGFPDAPVVTIDRSLHHGTAPADVCTLLDAFAGCPAEQQDAIQARYRRHLRSASVEELAFYLRRKEIPGRSDELMRELVGEREIDDVIALLQHASGEDTGLAWNITRAVAATRRSVDLMWFAQQCPDFAGYLFDEVGRQRDGEVVGMLLKMWSRGDIQRTGLSDGWFASVVTPAALLDAHQVLLQMDEEKLADEVFRKVLQEHPHGFAPNNIAVLLVALNPRSSRKQTDKTVRLLVRKLAEQLDTPPVTLTYLAELVAAVIRHADRIPAADELASQIDDVVYNLDKSARHRQYAAALGSLGAPEREREFRRRINS